MAVCHCLIKNWMILNSHVYSKSRCEGSGVQGGGSKLTHRFASPLPFAVPETHAFKHVVGCFMGPLPSVPDFVGSPVLMATI